MACGGDRSRLHLVKGIRGGDGRTYPFDPAYDLDALTVQAGQVEDLHLLILDPVSSAVAGDSHKGSETRRGLQPVVDFATSSGAAVVGISHFSKGTAGRDPLERVIGSQAFGAVARLVMVTAKPKEETGSRCLVRAKSNIGPDGGGFEYELDRVPVTTVGDIYGQRIDWGSELEGTALELLADAETPEVDEDLTKTAAAEQWIVNVLGTGKVDVKFLQDTASQAGHAWPTVKRAKRNLKSRGVTIDVLKSATWRGGWAWSLRKEIKPYEESQPQKGDPLIPFEGNQEGDQLIPFEEDKGDQHFGVSTFVEVDPLRPL
jgi:putative DNA primase/helicase